MLALVALVAHTSAVVSAQTSRAAIARALPALEQSAKAFVANRGCVSCHHNILPILTFRLAARRGFTIDAAILESVERRTFRELTSVRAFDDAVQGVNVGDPTPNDSWLLIAAKEAGLAPDLTNGVYAKRIATWQHDGHWTTSDFRPPHSSSVFTATATAVRAIRAYLPDDMRGLRDRTLAAARLWLNATTPASTEDATFRVLGLVWAEATHDEVAAAARDLLALQTPGGGWAQVAEGYPPDAYSTGEALYALRAAGITAGTTAWRKGAAFLLSAQQPDGTWHVHTRMISPAQVSPPYFTTGFPYKKDEYLSYAASCWATLALLGAIPDGLARPLPAPVASSAKNGPGAAMRAALFGSAAQLSAALPAGPIIDDATPNGTTLLMAAASDVEKVEVLLSRGADAKFRSPTGYDALTAATSYRGSSASVRALLDAGAAPDPPEQAKVRHSPLLMASMSGDLETASLLLSRGARANPGSGSGTLPISEAITFGHADVVRALIQAGAKATPVERTGINLLHWATITNRPDVIPELARARVDIDAIDEAGFTPLMYAATIDFGDTASLEALLAAGADRTIRNAAGRTALQQARRLGHWRIARALAR